MKKHHFLIFSFSVLFILVFVSRILKAQTFACIGDYGEAGQPELAVSNLVKSWNPEFIITTGDNNYLYGDSLTIDTNIGFYYHQYIYPYSGKYSNSDTTTKNRFFPSIGNHDLLTANGQPYYNYFSLPNNERYYDFVWGDVHFFSLNSDSSGGHEPDGTAANSFQAGWLMGKLSTSTSKWNIVYFHHAAFSSGGTHGSSSWMQWPFEQWGVTAVLGGHDHVFERLLVGKIPFFVNGLGGRNGIYALNAPLPESKKQYNGNFGAMKISAFADSIIFEFRTIADSLVDRFVIINTLSGLNNLDGSNVVSPNPFTTNSFIYLNRKLQNGTIQIYDMLGKEIEKRSNLAGNIIPISGKNILSGLLFYKISEDGKIVTSGRALKL